MKCLVFSLAVALAAPGLACASGQASPGASQDTPPDASDPAALAPGQTSGDGPPLFGPDANDPLTFDSPNAPGEPATATTSRAPGDLPAPPTPPASQAPQPAADARPVPLVTATTPDEAAAEAPQTTRPDGTPGDPPHWRTTPTQSQLLQTYPGRALSMRKSGRAVIRCEVELSGLLSGCTLVSEAPQGMNFGEASLRLSRWYRLDPPIRDGRPEAGVKVTIPMRWLVN